MNNRSISPSLLDRVFHQLARLFIGLHWIVGITTLSAKATPKEERSFVLLWLGIIILLIGFFALLFYSLTLFR
jgi:hypothetical protein